jgi:hypothetical protein
MPTTQATKDAAWNCRMATSAAVARVAAPATAQKWLRRNCVDSAIR